MSGLNEFCVAPFLQRAEKQEENAKRLQAEDQFKQYKTKAKVILQKQKDELTKNKELIDELRSYKDVEFTTIQSEFETEKEKIKKKYLKQFEDYRIRARSMLEEKEKQLVSMRNMLKKFDVPVSRTNDHDDDGMRKNKNKNQNKNSVDFDKDKSDVIDPTSLASMARLQAAREQQMQQLTSRLRRLQELLKKSEETQHSKDNELSFLRQQLSRMNEAQDVKKSADNLEYLKNVLLNYFQGKTDVKATISVVASVLKFSADEETKAREGKVAISDNYGSNNISGAIGSVLSIGSWWGGGNTTTSGCCGDIGLNQLNEMKDLQVEQDVKVLRVLILCVLIS